MIGGTSETNRTLKRCRLGGTQPIFDAKSTLQAMAICWDSGMGSSLWMIPGGIPILTFTFFGRIRKFAEICSNLDGISHIGGDFPKSFVRMSAVDMGLKRHFYEKRDRYQGETHRLILRRPHHTILPSSGRNYARSENDGSRPIALESGLF